MQSYLIMSLGFLLGLVCGMIAAFVALSMWAGEIVGKTINQARRQGLLESRPLSPAPPKR